MAFAPAVCRPCLRGKGFDILGYFRVANNVFPARARLLKQTITLLHVSDLHFHCLSWRPADWWSKRGLGALNLLLRRRWLFPLQRARALVRLMDGMPWDQLLISGDMTQLGTDAEFALARAELAPLLARGPKQVTVLPGNHDRYVTPRPGEQGFDAAFGDFFSGADEVGLHTRELGAGWWMAAWDSALPRPPFVAGGHVREGTLRATEVWLSSLPPGARVLLANHYPIAFPDGYRVHAQHELDNLAAVRDWVRAQPIALYLHGHIHRNWVLPGGGAHGLRVVNSASSTQVPGKGQRSAFHRLHLSNDGCEIEPLALPD